MKYKHLLQQQVLKELHHETIQHAKMFHVKQGATVDATKELALRGFYRLIRRS